MLLCLFGVLLLVACAPEQPPQSQPGSSVQITVSTHITIAATRPGITVPTVATTAPTVAQLPRMLPELKALYDRNPHTAGWVQIEGTMVNYPVMQTPDEPAWWNYYLHRNFDGDYEYRGCIYARECCDLLRPSDNIVLYGHNMADHTMFGELLDYRYYDHYRTHRYIQFSNLYERHTYEIFAVFRVSANPGNYEYYTYNEFGSQEEFDGFVSTCKSMCLYDIDFTPSYGDKMITLSTCDLSIDNGRLVVVAARID